MGSRIHGLKLVQQFLDNNSSFIVLHNEITAFSHEWNLIYEVH